MADKVPVAKRQQEEDSPTPLQTSPVLTEVQMQNLPLFLLFSPRSRSIRKAPPGLPQQQTTCHSPLMLLFRLLNPVPVAARAGGPQPPQNSFRAVEGGGEALF